MDIRIQSSNKQKKINPPIIYCIKHKYNILKKVKEGAINVLRYSVETHGDSSLKLGMDAAK